MRNALRWGVAVAVMTVMAPAVASAENLYAVMIEQFQQARGFVLEVLVVVILIIELVFVFRGSK